MRTVKKIDINLELIHVSNNATYIEFIKDGGLLVKRKPTKSTLTPNTVNDRLTYKIIEFRNLMGGIEYFAIQDEQDLIIKLLSISKDQFEATIREAREAGRNSGFSYGQFEGYKQGKFEGQRNVKYLPWWKRLFKLF